MILLYVTSMTRYEAKPTNDRVAWVEMNDTISGTDTTEGRIGCRERPLRRAAPALRAFAQDVGDGGLDAFAPRLRFDGLVDATHDEIPSSGR